MAKLTIPQAIDYLDIVSGVDGCMMTHTWPEGIEWAYCPDCRTQTVWVNKLAPHTLGGYCQNCKQWWNLIRWVLGLKPTKEQAEQLTIAVKLLDSELKEGE